MCVQGPKKEDVCLLLLTTVIATINIGIAFLAGLVPYCAPRRKVGKANVTDE